MRHFFIFTMFLLSFFCVSCSVDDDEVISSEVDLIKSINAQDISFMHISDTHGSSISIYPMVFILNNSDCDFGIISGDVLPSREMIETINNSNKPIFLVPGNHDAYDDGYGQSVFRNHVLNKISSSANINFGSDDANYYYVDIDKNGKKTRVIGLDQYEVDKVGKAGRYEIVMSQQQIDWFINLLEDSYNVDGIIVIIHCGFGNDKVGRRDVDNRNEFISVLSYNFITYLFTGSGNPLMIPEIINAYQTGININNEYNSGYEDGKLIVKTKFDGMHHNFVGYFGGHLHWDLCEYLPDFPKQLQALMCYSGRGTGKYMETDYNDLIKTVRGKNSYNINYNVIDYSHRKLGIYRLGANVINSGGTRDSIQFDINL